MLLRIGIPAGVHNVYGPLHEYVFYGSISEASSQRSLHDKCSFKLFSSTPEPRNRNSMHRLKIKSNVLSGEKYYR